MLSDFYKHEETDKIWWIDDMERVGQFLFSFDKRKIYNLFADYPFKLSEEEIVIFDNENHYWKEFFKDRK